MKKTSPTYWGLYFFCNGVGQVPFVWSDLSFLKATMLHRGDASHLLVFVFRLFVPIFVSLTILVLTRMDSHEDREVEIWDIQNCLGKNLSHEKNTLQWNNLHIIICLTPFWNKTHRRSIFRFHIRFSGVYSWALKTSNMPEDTTFRSPCHDYDRDLCHADLDPGEVKVRKNQHQDQKHQQPVSGFTPPEKISSLTRQASSRFWVNIRKKYIEQKTPPSKWVLLLCFIQDLHDRVRFALPQKN